MGVQLVSLNEIQSLKVFSEREDLIDGFMELSFTTMSFEEPGFFNTTDVFIYIV